MYTLRREQWIECPIDEVFAFFADAQNLEEITPPWVGFKILSMSTDSIEEGTLSLSPATARHTRSLADKYMRVESPYSFVDEQTRGPYKKWRHKHTFEAHGSRTKMIDEVQYLLPFLIIGRILHAVKVRKDVCRICAPAGIEASGHLCAVPHGPAVIVIEILRGAIPDLI